MVPEKLIIFDFSGTLSLESTTFSRPDTLMKHLSQSGLADLGFNTPEIFWEQIVNPTWTEGSTTGVGYKQIMETRIRNILVQNMAIISCVMISDAVSSFVDRYLRHSRIDRRWQPILQQVSRTPGVCVIIATDHYAEATGYIIAFLKELQIHALPARELFADPDASAFTVATSADLGVHKDNPRFWEILKSGLHLGAIRRILLIDDFGYNEQRGNAYGSTEKVEARTHNTVKLLQEVFSTKVHVIPFMIEDNKKEAAFGNLVKHTSAIIEQYLSPTVNEK